MTNDCDHNDNDDSGDDNNDNDDNDDNDDNNDNDDNDANDDDSINVNQVNSTHWLGKERWFGETAGGTLSLRCFLLLLFQGFVVAVFWLF